MTKLTMIKSSCWLDGLSPSKMRKGFWKLGSRASEASSATSGSPRSLTWWLIPQLWLQGRASGAWVLKSSYIRACLKEGAWVDEKAHLSDPSVPLVKGGGIFKEMVAVVVLEHGQRANTYTKVIRAGGGIVLEMAGLLDLQAIKSQVTHIFLDPWVTQGPKQELFRRLQEHVISTCPGAAFLWYRFLHQVHTTRKYL